MRLIQSLAPAAVAGAMFCWAGGCASQQSDINPVVPDSAVQTSSGDKAIGFTAPSDGIVYVRDDNDNRIVYSNDIKKDQVVRYDPDSRQVLLDDTSVARSVPNSHQHSIFFRPIRSIEAAQAQAAAAASNNADRGPATRPSDNVPVIRVPLGVQVDVQTQPASPR